MGDALSVKRIGIFGHVGNENLGDEAIIAAVIQNIRHRYPDVEIYGFSINPTDTLKRHKVATSPIRRIRKDSYQLRQGRETSINAQKWKKEKNLRERIKTRLKPFPLIYTLVKRINESLHFFLDSLGELIFLVKSINNLKRINLLIVSGSGQLFDYFGGPWGNPYTIFKWSIIAKMLGTKVAFVSVGAGPINSSLSKFFIKQALSLASYYSYRDQSSKKLIEELGVPGGNPVFPDLVYSLQLTRIPSVSPPLSSVPLVGINPMPFFDHRYWPESNKCTYENYTRTLALFALWLLQTDHNVLFFHTQLRVDPYVIRDIKLIMASEGGGGYEHRLIDRPILTLEDLIAQISMTDIVVATRFHGILISYLLEKPVLGISYHKKTDDLMAQMGQSEYVLDISCLDLDFLIERFSALESNREIIKHGIEDKILEQRRALEMQYDCVLRLLEKRPL